MLVNNAANMDITHWAQGAPDGYGGNSYSAPVVLKGRWEKRTDLVVSPNGENITSKARIFLDKEIGLGDYLYLGSSTVSDPRTVSGAYEVLQVRKIPSVDGTRFEYIVYL